MVPALNGRVLGRDGLGEEPRLSRNIVVERIE